MEPSPDCGLCPRLKDFRAENRRKYPDFFNAPVPSFGQQRPGLLVVGLAPGLKGANWSGRPFTGDAAGDLLYPALLKHGFAGGQYAARPDDGLQMLAARITNAVRCVPPQNRPVGQEERACRRFLEAEIAALPAGAVILALGVVAHNAVLKSLSLRVADYKFAHAAEHRLPGSMTLLNSYHCSRYNVNTGRLTPEMFDQVFAHARQLVDAANSGAG